MIVKPENMDFSNKNIIMIISGLPGVGKTTLALSAPDVALIDTDEGLARVKPAHRKDAVICKTYEELLSDIESLRGKYQTLVIDTTGELIELMKPWVVKHDAKAGKKTGGISLSGYGDIGEEFLRLSSDLRKFFNVIFVFHVTEKSDGEVTKYILDCEGKTRNVVWKPVDIGGMVQIINGERYLGIGVSENYNSKCCYGMNGLIKIPNLKDGEPNDFLTKLFAQVKSNIAEETRIYKAQRATYDAAIAAGKELIDTLDKPEDAFTVLDQIRKLDHAMTSLKELEAAFKAKVKELGYVYDPKAKTYVVAAE